jgi:hypothetical protein
MGARNAAELTSGENSAPRCMSRDRLRELILLLAIGSAVTIVVFFLALWLLPFETFTPFPFPRSPGFP